jgi:hypothetical protein
MEAAVVVVGRKIKDLVVSGERTGGGRGGGKQRLIFPDSFVPK